MERLDLVQFHWWDYGAPADVDVAIWLEELRQGRQDPLRQRHQFRSAVGSTSWWPPACRSARCRCSIPCSTTRPENGLIELAARQGIDLLCYGTVAGGFLGERWLGAPEPDGPLENRSLTKYKLIIDDFGGWALFQDLLRRCKVARLPNGMASTSPPWRAGMCSTGRGVAAVIVGARNRDHLAGNLADRRGCSLEPRTPPRSTPCSRRR